MSLLPTAYRLLPASVDERPHARCDEERGGGRVVQAGADLGLGARLKRAAAHLGPLFARDAAERLDHPRVELPTTEGFQLRRRLVVAAAPAVDAVARHRVEGVGDGEDARVRIDLLAAQPRRVARAVPTLVVLRA